MARLGQCKTCGGKVSSEATTCPHCGQPDPYVAQGEAAAAADPEAAAYLDPEPDSYLYDLKKEVLDYLAKGKKIQAIQFVIRSTGWDLVESKKYVERFQ